MVRSQPESTAGGDRLSQLEDRVLGNILSFLPANEAARAALLSSRWRHVFASVHTVSLEEPESPIHEKDDGYDGYPGSPSCGQLPPDPNAPPHFSTIVSAAIIGRHRRRGGAVPLRALRVAVETYGGRRDDPKLDQWISYAVQQAAPDGLDLELRLWCRVLLCQRPYALRREQNKTSGPPIISESAVHNTIMPEPPAPEPDVFDYVPPPPAPPLPPGSPADLGVGSKSNQNDDDDGRVVWSDDNYDADDGGVVVCTDDNHDDDIVFVCSQDNGDGDVGSKPNDEGDEDSDVCSDDVDNRPWNPYCAESVHEYTVPGALFSCAELRSLSLGSCWLAPPATVNLPSLVTLLLSHVPDDGADVEWLIAGCPRLADLTLEACDAVTALSVSGGAGARCLRRLALRCCHNLATVEFDSSELRAFEYRGAVPDAASFLTMHGGAGRVAYCKVDICGAEVTSEEELVNLRRLLRLFANAEHLHLESARLGFGLDKDVPARLAAFSNLRHLEMRGCLPDHDAGVIDAVSRILEHAPNLEALSLVFHPHEHGQRCQPRGFREAELRDAHHLSYHQLPVLSTPSAATIPCLRSRVREINLVHYQGRTAQRALAKFLLCNAPAVDKLWCEFAEGPMWTQVQLMNEIKGWLSNKSASTHFA